MPERRDVTAGGARSRGENKESRAHTPALAATKAKSVFLASISHEMRTPLNAIVAMTDLLSESQPTAPGRLRAASRPGVGKPCSWSTTCWTSPKIEADQLVIESVPFDLYAPLDDVSELLASRVQEKQQLGFVTFFVEPSAPQMVVGDRDTLASGAAESRRQCRRSRATARVTIIASNPSSTRQARSDAVRRVRYRHRHSADKLTRVFESFTQVDASTTRKYGGTGLA